MDDAELTERIAAHPRWHHRFDFGAVSTPVADPAEVNRQEQRRRYFLDALAKVTGGSLAGRRVLDLGCGEGYFSLMASETGADFVLGVDEHEAHVERASLVFAAKGVDPARYRFAQVDVLEQGVGESFDVVLCLGLMDRISRPVELFELIASTGAELVVLDTSVSFAPSSVFEVARGHGPGERPGAFEHELMLIPTRGAVVELAAQFGFQTAALAHHMSDYTGARDYRIQRRVAFICSSGPSLDAVEREPPPPVYPWWAGLLDPARRGWQRAPRS